MHVSDGYIPVVSNKALTKTSKIVHIPDTKVIRVYVYTLNSIMSPETLLVIGNTST